jgi:hypothetical protein
MTRPARVRRARTIRPGTGTETGTQMETGGKVTILGKGYDRLRRV